MEASLKEQKLAESDQHYLNIVLEPVRVCANYKPKFGQGVGAGLSVDEFQRHGDIVRYRTSASEVVLQHLSYF